MYRQNFYERVIPTVEYKLIIRAVFLRFAQLTGIILLLLGRSAVKIICPYCLRQLASESESFQLLVGQPIYLDSPIENLPNQLLEVVRPYRSRSSSGGSNLIGAPSNMKLASRSTESCTGLFVSRA